MKGHCCACAGICMHIGGPYYCDKHKEVLHLPMNTTLSNWHYCKEHCYCQNEKVGEVKHKKCCMCGHRVALGAHSS
jgi:hypothetical protein